MEGLFLAPPKAPQGAGQVLVEAPWVKAGPGACAGWGRGIAESGRGGNQLLESGPGLLSLTVIILDKKQIKWRGRGLGRERIKGQPG